MMFIKLSLRNARRQTGDYLVYFVTVVLSAALVHAFNGLIFSEELRNLSSFMESLPYFIIMASIMVICIMGWLIQYITVFMFSRRSRELGTYILIGLENKQVAGMFFLENLIAGSVALAAGLLLGNLIFQILRAITLSLFHAPYTFSLASSPKAAALTFVYFAAIYLLALRKSRKRIKTMNIHDLIYYERQNEEAAVEKRNNRKRLFTASILSGIVGTPLLLTGSLSCCLIGTGFLVFFLYGFFLSFSSGIPAWFEKHPGKKYASHTLLVFRTLSAKLTTMGLTMATLALLFTVTLISEGTGMLFGTLFEDRVEGSTCFDILLGSEPFESLENDSEEENLLTAESENTASGLDPYLEYIQEEIPLRASMQYVIYQGETLQVTEYIEENAEYFSYYKYDPLMAYSDYTALRAMLGYGEVPLEPGHYIIHCMSYLEKTMKAYNQPVSVNGTVLTPGAVLTEHFAQKLWDGNGRGFLLVVPDECLASRPVSHSIYAAMTSTPLTQAQDDHLRKIHENQQGGTAGLNSYGTGSYTLLSRTALEREYAAMSACTIFPLYYLALILTMVSATILTVQQLSESVRYRQQFTLLQKLGMDRREMVTALQKQLAIYYAMPVLPSLLISIPFLWNMGHAFEPGTINGPWHLAEILSVALGLFFLIYFVYILIAYENLRKSVLTSSRILQPPYWH